MDELVRTIPEQLHKIEKGGMLVCGPYETSGTEKIKAKTRTLKVTSNLFVRIVSHTQGKRKVQMHLKHLNENLFKSVTMLLKKKRHIQILKTIYLFID